MPGQGDRKDVNDLGTSISLPHPFIHTVSVLIKRIEQSACSGVLVFMKTPRLLGMSHAGDEGQPFSGRELGVFHGVP